MKKKFLLGIIAATMTCVALVGCGKNNDEARVVEMGPGMSVEATGNHGTFTMEGDSSLGEWNDEDVMNMFNPNFQMMNLYY